MMYLLDVNVLIAFAYDNHSLHDRTAHWVQEVQSANLPARSFVTCSMVELGFIRIAPGKKGLASNLAAARADLSRIRAALGFEVLGDSLHGNQLPDWVTRPDQTTDGHLLQLADHHQVRFATLDVGIPGAELIPYERGLPLEVRDSANQRNFDMTTEGRFVSFENYTGEPGTIPGEPDPRWTIDPKTGFPCVRATLGVKKITTEDVKRWLEDFP